MDVNLHSVTSIRVEQSREVPDCSYTPGDLKRCGPLEIGEDHGNVVPDCLGMCDQTACKKATPVVIHIMTHVDLDMVPCTITLDPQMWVSAEDMQIELC